LQRYQGNGETGLALEIKGRGLKALYHPGAAVTHLIPGTRLTAESFEEKGFYQGVGRSFANIRRNGGLPQQARSWSDRIRPMKWRFERASLLRNATAQNMRFLVSRARLAGVWFHEDQVRNDAKLLAWVMKPDYFDYRLPDGWESHFSLGDASH
jgi:hypothetical protein